MRPLRARPAHPSLFTDFLCSQTIFEHANENKSAIPECELKREGRRENRTEAIQEIPFANCKFSCMFFAICRFPPKVSFNRFNDHANMKAEDKIILPR